MALSWPTSPQRDLPLREEAACEQGFSEIESGTLPSSVMAKAIAKKQRDEVMARALYGELPVSHLMGHDSSS